METLKTDDVRRIVRRLPRVVREAMKKHPIILAGGFIRSVILNEEPNDVDLFGPNPDALKTIADELKKSYTRRFESKNAITLRGFGKLPVQFIHRWRYEARYVWKLLAEFDFTIAQACVWFEMSETGEGGAWRSKCSESFYPDLAAKRLVYTRPIRDEEAGGSLLRAIKFVRRGFSLNPEDLSGLIERLLSGIDEDRMTAIGIEREHMMVSLLREVDPLAILPDETFPEEGEEDEQ